MSSGGLEPEFLPCRYCHCHAAADVNTRKKMGALSQLFAWASQPAVPKKQSSKPSSQAPSQVSTPRRPTRTTQDGVQSADVLQLLNAFSSGGMQF